MGECRIAFRVPDGLWGASEDKEVGVRTGLPLNGLLFAGTSQPAIMVEGLQGR